MQEVLDIVDEKNVVIGEAPIDQIYEKRLNHRIVHVLIFNDKGEIFLHQRSAKDDFCPGHWCTSAGGYVKKGETYEQAAKRELQKELGIKTSLTKLDECTYDHYKMRKFLQIFRAVHQGPLTLKLDEVGGRWFSVADVKDMVKKNQLVAPELAHVIERLYP